MEKITVQDITTTLSLMHGKRCDRFDLALEVTKTKGDPMQAFEAIKEAQKARKVRCNKIGKGDAARFDIELV
jgi:hypothetical protein